MDANSLIQSLLQAILLEDGEEEIPIGKAYDNLDEKSFDDSVNPPQGPSGTQKIPNLKTGEPEKDTPPTKVIARDDPKNGSF